MICEVLRLSICIYFKSENSELNTVKKGFKIQHTGVGLSYHKINGVKFETI